MTKLTERTVKIVLGDWGGDGHEKTSTTVVTLRGDDVSDAALEASYRAAVEDTGVDLNDVFAEYEDQMFLMEDIITVWEEGESARIAAHSISGALPVEGTCFDSDEYYDHVYGDPGPTVYSAIDILMAFTGYTVPNFSWSVVDIPTLMGGDGTVLSDKNGYHRTFFGYGLFR